jgi:hypothetical protein
MNRNLWLLAVLQGLFLTNNVTFIAINGLVGLSLAPLWLDGDAAGDGLCGGRRAVHGAGRGGTQARWGRSAPSSSGCWWRWPRCAAVRLCAATRAQLLAGGARPRWWPATTRQRRPLPLRRGRTGAGRPFAKKPCRWSWPAACWARRRAQPGGGTRATWPTRPLSAPTWRWPAWRCCDGCWPSCSSRRPPRDRRAEGRSVTRNHAAAGLHRRRRAGALGFGVMNLLMAATPMAMQQCGLPFLRRGAGAGVACDRHVRAGLLHRPPDQALRHLPIMGVGVALNLACVADRALGRGPAAVPGRAVCAGAGLEFPVHRQHHAGAHRLPPEEKDKRAGALNFSCSPRSRSPRWLPACWSPRRAGPG